MAFFGRGSDPKLFELPRELLANVLMEATDSARHAGAGAQGGEGARRRSDAVALHERRRASTERASTAAAVEKAATQVKAVKPDDARRDGRGEARARRTGLGWHLYQVSEPVAKVGPMLKDWSALWNRPAFAKWIQDEIGRRAALPRVRIAPLPSAVELPKDTVHLEISVPRDDGTT